MQACIYEEYGPAEVVKVGQVRKANGEGRRSARPCARKLGDHGGLALPRSRISDRIQVDGPAHARLVPAEKRHPGDGFSGVVEATGKNVSRFRVGDHVFGAASPMRRGAHAEYVAVKESGAIIGKPASLTDQEAAAIPFGGNSALAFLRDFRKGEAGPTRSRRRGFGRRGGVGGANRTASWCGGDRRMQHARTWSSCGPSVRIT